MGMAGVIRLGKDVAVEVVGAVVVVVVAHGAGLQPHLGPEVGPATHRPTEPAEAPAPRLQSDSSDSSLGNKPLKKRHAEGKRIIRENFKTEKEKLKSKKELERTSI
jgi:hypothetical protein